MSGKQIQQNVLWTAKNPGHYFGITEYLDITEYLNILIQPYKGSDVK